MNTKHFYCDNCKTTYTQKPSIFRIPPICPECTQIAEDLAYETAEGDFTPFHYQVYSEFENFLFTDDFDQAVEEFNKHTNVWLWNTYKGMDIKAREDGYGEYDPIEFHKQQLEKVRNRMQKELNNE